MTVDTRCKLSLWNPESYEVFFFFFCMYMLTLLLENNVANYVVAVRDIHPTAAILT